MTSRNNLDQFYTKKETALKCLSTLENHINVDIYDFHLEPSAGDGAFF
jgi:hypothetical protein